MRRLHILIALTIFFSLNNYIGFAQTEPLLQAIQKNDIAAVAGLLDKGADVHITDKEGDNVLMYAALYSTKECMELLLKKGALPDATNPIGETAIFWCSHDLDKIKLLLDYHADVNVKTANGNTPLLSAAVGSSQGEMIRLLLAHGADAKAKNNRRVTTLMQASLFGDTASARLLLNNGAELEAKAMDQQTVLSFALKTLNTPMVKWLVHQGADVNSLDAYKTKPLAYAVVLNDIDMVKALLPGTTDLNAQDIDGMTTLMWATYSEDDNPSIVKLLLDNGAIVTPKDKNGETALTWALKKGNTKTVALLKKAGAK